MKRNNQKEAVHVRDGVKAEAAQNRKRGARVWNTKGPLHLQPARKAVLGEASSSAGNSLGNRLGYHLLTGHPLIKAVCLNIQPQMNRTWFILCKDRFWSSQIVHRHMSPTIIPRLFISESLPRREGGAGAGRNQQCVYLESFLWM